MKSSLTSAPTEKVEKFDVGKMHVKGSREQQKFVDDGSGKVRTALTFAPLGFQPCR